MSAQRDLEEALNRIIPVGEKGDAVKAYLLRLFKEARDEFAAQMIEAHARSPLNTRPRGYGGADFSESHRRPAS